MSSSDLDTIVFAVIVLGVLWAGVRVAAMVFTDRELDEGLEGRKVSVPSPFKAWLAHHAEREAKDRAFELEKLRIDKNVTYHEPRARMELG